MNKETYVYYNFLLREDLRRELKVLAAKRGMHIYKALEEAIEEWIQIQKNGNS